MHARAIGVAVAAALLTTIGVLCQSPARSASVRPMRRRQTASMTPSPPHGIDRERAGRDCGVRHITPSTGGKVVRAIGGGQSLH